MRREVKSRSGTRVAWHGRSHRLYSSVRHDGKGSPAVRAQRARRPCTAGMRATKAWQSVRSATAAQLCAGLALVSMPYTSAHPDAFRTVGAAPLKHYLVRSATEACGPSAPSVRPHCTARQRRAAAEPVAVLPMAATWSKICSCIIGPTGDKRTAGQSGIAILRSMNAPDVAPSPIPVAMGEKVPHMALQKRRISRGRRAEPTGECRWAYGRRCSCGTPSCQHRHPDVQAAPCRVDAVTASDAMWGPSVGRPDWGAQPWCATTIRQKHSCYSSRGMARKTAHASLKGRSDRR